MGGKKALEISSAIFHLILDKPTNLLIITQILYQCFIAILLTNQEDFYYF